MALSTDSNVQRRLLREPDPNLLKGWPTENRTVILIRHGEVSPHPANGRLLDVHEQI
jgi:hypothetical protein